MATNLWSSTGQSYHFIIKEPKEYTWSPYYCSFEQLYPFQLRRHHPLFDSQSAIAAAAAAAAAADIVGPADSGQRSFERTAAGVAVAEDSLNNNSG